MPRFDYKALAEGGEVLTGSLSAATREAAIEALRGRKVAPLQVVAAQGGARRRRLFERRKPNERDLMLFTRELAILLHAGSPVDQSLRVLDELSSDGPMAGVAANLLVEVNAGATLSDAMAAQPEIFPHFYAGMVRAGEAGGALGAVLDRLGVMLEKAEALKQTLRSALTYPILVLLLTGLSLVVLLVFVVPEFRSMFEDAGVEPPVATRIVLGVSDFVTEWGLLTMAVIALAVFVVVRGGRTPAGAARRDAAILAAPLFGDLVRKVETARFCRSLGTLRANGVALVDGVGIAAGTMRNHAAMNAAAKIVAPLSKGEGLAAPMRATDIFPSLAVQLVAVGEESGRLEEMLLQVADVYDVEVGRTVQRLLALLSPAMTIGLGLLIAFIIGAILSAILGSYDIAF